VFSNISSDISECDSVLEYLESVKKAIADKRAGLATSLQQVRSLRCGIRRLPPEILFRIFAYCYTSNYRWTVRTVSKVCKSWYAAIYASTYFWQRVDLKLGREDFDKNPLAPFLSDRLKASLRTDLSLGAFRTASQIAQVNGGQRFLQVKLRFLDTFSLEYMPFLASLAQKTQSLEIQYISRDCMPTVKKAFSKIIFPVLQNLLLNNDYGNWEDLPFLLQSFPQVCHLSIVTTHRLDLTTLSGLFPQIQHLEIRRPCLTDIASILNQCNILTSLSIGPEIQSSDLTSIQSDTLALPLVQRLVLKTSETLWFSLCLLESLLLPKLQDLNITFTDGARNSLSPYDEGWSLPTVYIASHIHKSRCMLTTFRIRGVITEIDCMVDLLQELPSLETLEYQALRCLPEFEDDILTIDHNINLWLNLRPEGQSNAILPQLQRIDLAVEMSNMVDIAKVLLSRCSTQLHTANLVFYVEESSKSKSKNDDEQDIYLANTRSEMITLFSNQQLARIAITDMLIVRKGSDRFSKFHDFI
jgi:hypothetical protein